MCVMLRVEMKRHFLKYLGCYDIDFFTELLLFIETLFSEKLCLEFYVKRSILNGVF